MSAALVGRAMLLLLVACDWGAPAERPAPDPAPPASPPVTPAPPALLLGVTEVRTPDDVVRVSDLQDIRGRVHLDVWFDPAHTTFEGLGNTLDAWGLERIDGDGESWRVATPSGDAWAARLEPAPEVARVREALDQQPLETGALREGRETYGPLVHAWSWRSGGPVEGSTGAEAPPRAVLPHALPGWAAECLAPAMEELHAGVSRGLGWERAWRPDPSTWVLVTQDYGGCRATGWLVLAADAPVADLTVGGRAVAQVGSAALHDIAISVLSQPRASDDTDAAFAVGALQDAPPETRARAAASAVAPWQERVVRDWARVDEESALVWARASDTVAARALLVHLDPTDRAAALADPNAPFDVLLSALAAWRPNGGEGADVLARLRKSPDPRVRERAWERTAGARTESCVARQDALGNAAMKDVAEIWAECPIPGVREAAFARALALDRAAAGKLVADTLTAPETVPSAVQAVRAAANLGRYDLLTPFVARSDVARAPRLEALRLIVAGSQPNARALVEAHGVYLGFKAGSPATAGG